MKKALLLFLCLQVLICGMILSACNCSGSDKVPKAETPTVETTTEEPFTEMDFEDEVTIPIEEYEGVGGL